LLKQRKDDLPTAEDAWLEAGTITVTHGKPYSVLSQPKIPQDWQNQASAFPAFS